MAGASQIFARQLSNVMAGNRKYLVGAEKNPRAVSGTKREESRGEERIIRAGANSRAGLESRMTYGDLGFEQMRWGWLRNGVGGLEREPQSG
jgi:hypothetical protein